MQENDIFSRIPWERIRMLSIDDLKVTLLLENEENVREYDFPTAEKKNEALDIWFGCTNPRSDREFI